MNLYERFRYGMFLCSGYKMDLSPYKNLWFLWRQSLTVFKVCVSSWSFWVSGTVLTTCSALLVCLSVCLSVIVLTACVCDRTVRMLRAPVLACSSGPTWGLTGLVFGFTWISPPPYTPWVSQHKQAVLSTVIIHNTLWSSLLLLRLYC